MRRHRRQMNDAGSQKHRHRHVSERAHERTKPADATGLSLGGQECEAQIRVGQIASGGERKAIAGGSDDEIDRRVLFE
jgi:hypothetical protein